MRGGSAWARLVGFRVCSRTQDITTRPNYIPIQYQTILSNAQHIWPSLSLTDPQKI